MLALSFNGLSQDAKTILWTGVLDRLYAIGLYWHSGRSDKGRFADEPHTYLIINGNSSGLITRSFDTETSKIFGADYNRVQFFNVTSELEKFFVAAKRFVEMQNKPLEIKRICNGCAVTITPVDIHVDATEVIKRATEIAEQIRKEEFSV